jgi:uncharacterized protein YggE
MNTKIKDSLGVVIIITLLLFGYSAYEYVGVFSRSIEPSSFRSFAVSSTADVTAIPDIAQFTFSVITQGGTDLLALQKKTTEKINSALEFIETKGVEKKDIKTQNYSVQPRYQYYSCPKTGGPCPPADIVGYTVSQTVQVKVRDFSVIGDILAGVVERGATNVSQLSFDIDDSDALENEARAKAVKKAKEKAEVVAKAGGFKVGRILSINEGGYYAPRYAETMSLDSAGGGASPTIEPGSQEISVNLTVVYEIR